MSLADLKREIPGIQWDLYFSTLGLKEVEELNVAQMAAVKESADLMNEMDMNVLKSYLEWKVIDAAAAYLSDDFVAQNFEFLRENAFR